MKQAGVSRVTLEISYKVFHKITVGSKKMFNHYIVDTLVWFANFVINLYSKKNTVAVATLLYPPRLAWLQDNGPEPPNYQNQKAKIDFLNGRIDEPFK